LVLLCLVAVDAPAADPPPYTVTAKAIRSGDGILVSAKIVENQIQFVPKVGNANVTTILSEPRVMLNAGQRAEIEIGQAPADPKGVTPPNLQGNPQSGIRTEIISVKGQDRVLMVTTVTENGTIVWADAATVPITSKAESATKPVASTQP
jgi:hypothetical protein